MRTRAKALTVAVAMVTTFAILPTFGAAADPLEDGSYDVLVEDATFTVDVVDGQPSVEGTDGVAFTFSFDDETGRVLDEFGVTVGDVTYEVEVDEDGTVTVTQDEDEGEESEGEEPEGDDLADGDEKGDDDADIEALEEGAEPESLEADREADGEADGEGHGEVVSTVAQCAPAGKQAREAGLPNHGFFVSAAAKGEEVEFDVDGETHTADLSSQEGADAFCDLAEELLTAAESADEVGTAEADEADDGDDTEDAGGKGRGNGHGRANAPGQLKKAG